MMSITDDTSRMASLMKQPRQSDGIRSLAAFVAVLSCVYSVVLAYVNEYAAEPYMDEIFHIPQTQKYCDGNFDEWDPKITTFPGLYLFSAAYAHAASYLGANFCTVSVLRSVNILFAIGNAVLVVKLRSTIMPSDPNPLLHAAMIVTFPINFFFSFLFYTDSGAAFFVLLMYVLAERVNLSWYPYGRGGYVFSALSGAVAVLFRQTNFVWVCFVAGTVVVRCVELSHGNFIYGSSKQEAKRTGTSVIKNCARRVFINFVVVVGSNLFELFQLVWPFVVVALGFVVFLVKNGGIVVGDKSSHEVSFHVSQLLYCTVVIASGFGVSLITPRQIKNFAESVRRNAKTAKGLFFMVSITGAALIAIWRFSPVHKFMLADNRHYTFYIWRKFFLKHPMAKFLPTPFYLFLGWRCWVELRRARSPLWKLVFGIAVSLVLIPSPLVEPRYYLVPFIIFHLNTGTQSSFQLWTTSIVYGVVNAATLYIYLRYPYQWVDGSTARFMW